MPLLITIILTINTIISSALATPSNLKATSHQTSAPNLIQCLGKEEQKIHLKKLFGPLYSLNQHLVNFLVSVDFPPLRPQFLQAICHPKAGTLSPSLKFLQILLENREAAFELPPKTNPIERESAERSVEGVMVEIPGFFVEYLGNIQAEMPRANCLTNNINAINHYQAMLKHVENEKNAEYFLFNKERVKKIFWELRKFNFYYQACAKKNLEKPQEKKTKKEGKNSQSKTKNKK